MWAKMCKEQTHAKPAKCREAGKKLQTCFLREKKDHGDSDGEDGDIYKKCNNEANEAAGLPPMTLLLQKNQELDVGGWKKWWTSDGYANMWAKMCKEQTHAKPAKCREAGKKLQACFLREKKDHGDSDGEDDDIYKKCNNEANEAAGLPPMTLLLQKNQELDVGG